MKIMDDKPIIIQENENEKQITKDEFDSLCNNSKIKLVQIKENTFKILYKLYN